jgi:hypothetical protein
MEEKKKTILSIVGEMKKEGNVTSLRMLTIQNNVRKSLGLKQKKVCSTSRQRIVSIIREVIGEENLIEEVGYGKYAEGRKPTKFSIRDFDAAFKCIENYFSKKAEKARKLKTGQKKLVVAKLISILAKVNETGNNIISKDLLFELIGAKTPLAGTLKNWSSMLEKEGITLSIKSEGRKGIYEIKNLEETKSKLETLYGKLTESSESVKRKTKPYTPTTISEENKKLTEEEERVVYLLSKICFNKDVPYSDIWKQLRKQGILGFNLNNLINRAGLRKWFVQTRKAVPGGFENQIKFVGNLEAVASLMGQEIEKTILIRSSLEPEEIRAMMSNSKIVLKVSMPNANIYSVTCSKSMLSMLDLFKLRMSFRGYDSFIEEEDEKFVDSIIDEISDKITK